MVECSLVDWQQVDDDPDLDPTRLSIWMLIQIRIRILLKVLYMLKNKIKNLLLFTPVSFYIGFSFFYRHRFHNFSILRTEYWNLLEKVWSGTFSFSFGWNEPGSSKSSIRPNTNHNIGWTLQTLVFLMAREFLVELLLCVLLVDELKYATTVTSTSCSPGVEKL